MLNIKRAFKRNLRRLYGNNKNWTGGLRMALRRFYKDYYFCKFQKKARKQHDNYISERKELETKCQFFCPRGRSDWDIR